MAHLRSTPGPKGNYKLKKSQLIIEYPYIQGVTGGTDQTSGGKFLLLNYTEKPQNTYIQSWPVWEIMASEI